EQPCEPGRRHRCAEDRRRTTTGQARRRPTRRVTARPHPAIQRPNCRHRLGPALTSPRRADNGRDINKVGRSFGSGCRPGGPGGRRGGWYDFTRRFGRRRPERAEHPNSVMPITLLDIILIGVMLISGLLAMIRGFMREILSIAAWVIAAGVTLYFYAKLLPFAKSYFNNDIIAAAVVVGGTFLITLLIVSVITVRFSDMVLDSRIGALDRTLGFLFGLARGLVIVVIAFLFFAWLVPDRSQPDWVRSAKSRVVLQGTGDWLMSMLPDDPESTILKRLKKPKPEE